MKRSIPWTLCLLVACGPTEDAPTDETDVDTDTEETDSETDETDDTDTTEETDETEVPAEPYVTTVPASVETELGGASMDFGVYSRYQQIVPTSLLPADAVEILEVRFRRSGAEGAAAQTTSIPTAELWLGTAAGSPLSSTFADNLTGDEQRVFNDAIDLVAATGDGLLFDDFVVTVDPPFAYDPADGALLLDLHMPTVGSNVLFDCKNDGTMPVVMSSAAGTPAMSNNLSGCGMVVQLLVR